MLRKLYLVPTPIQYTYFRVSFRVEIVLSLKNIENIDVRSHRRMNIQCIKRILQVNSFNALANDLYVRDPRKNQIGCISQSTNQLKIHGFLMAANLIDAPQREG